MMDFSTCCRDLKPHNVLLEEDDTPVLMDFGSMGEAKIEINGAAQARALQVFILCFPAFILWIYFALVDTEVSMTLNSLEATPIPSIASQNTNVADAYFKERKNKNTKSKKTKFCLPR